MVPPVIHTLRLGVHAIAGYKRCSSLSLFIFLKYVCSWFIAYYCTCFKITGHQGKTNDTYTRGIFPLSPLHGPRLTNKAGDGMETAVSYA